KDDDCDGSIDETWTNKGTSCFTGQGECYRTGVYVCRADGTNTQCNAPVVSGTTETCNAKDDDCDGATDETWTNKGTSCFTGQGECYRTGVYVCRADGTNTQCNAPVVSGTTETCNAKDDDCDGATDETWTNKGAACFTGQGECYRTGVFVCRADGTNTQCDAPVVAGTTETCNQKDDDCDGATDETFTNKGTACSAGIGECYRTGVFACRADGTGTECNAPVAAGTAETCNGKDDNCNGTTDETFTNKGTSCFTGQGECYRTGVFVCRADGTATECNAPVVAGVTETCNAKDDDCDGSIDETWTNKGTSCFTGQGECYRTGVYVCRADGTNTQCNAPVVAGTTETCNQKDDDCDGATDETWTNKGAACFTGVGECYRTGINVCRADGTGIQCDAPVVAGTTETCNGKDDDCDGLTDETWTNKGAACFAGVGECYRTGINVCRADGTGIQCNAPVVAGTAETCNGKDDDCNGTTDETFTDKNTACFAGVGECYRTGIRVCRADGTGTECNAPVVAGTAETCNGKDDDCDSATDETFTDKGTACFTGTGECYRTGVNVCRADGTGTQCNAPVVAGTTETCNGKDDDCDSSTDETWPAKGSVCTTGYGVCARSGTSVCKADGTGIECNAPVVTGSPEVCDYLDNDCDNSADEDFIQGGKYYRATNCGNCNTDCTAIYALPNAYGTCNTTPATPVCRMNCNAGYFDLNAVPDDGCEFLLDTTAIYVSESDPGAADDATCGLGPGGTGAGNHPCLTIAQGLARSVAAGRSKVLVADGLYVETVVMRNGKSLFGGYRADTWEAHPDSTMSIIP
ncbi:MAG: hypothetical protein FJ087_22505, partial [Deltaproteobacteria bacterium]|nr:hypothetical protein [Deltaproteobacteria bacterium]